MALFFITGNEHKFAEAKAIIPELEQLDIDLPEVQHLDPREIIKAKLAAAYKHRSGEFLVEDVSLRMECMGSLPGPFIKWFIKDRGIEWLAHEAQLHKMYGAQAVCMIGYAKSPTQVEFFEGKVQGRIVPPRGSRGFGFDFIFEPEGYGRTWAEMSADEKNRISHRRLALEQLRAYLK